jgi:hypothetical protein
VVAVWVLADSGRPPSRRLVRLFLFSVTTASSLVVAVGGFVVAGGRFCFFCYFLSFYLCLFIGMLFVFVSVCSVFSEIGGYIWFRKPERVWFF